jgi:CopG family transcriptional regulator/antitoxin EndoAI
MAGKIYYKNVGDISMAQAKRIMVSLPGTLLQEVDGIVRRETGNRSAFVREAMLLLIAERRRRERIESYRSGYEKAGKLNLALAEEGFAEDCRDLEKYEDHLADARSGREGNRD